VRCGRLIPIATASAAISLAELDAALAATHVVGVNNNVAFLRRAAQRFLTTHHGSSNSARKTTRGT